MPRPKLSVSLEDEIIKNMTEGMTRKDVCYLVGISEENLKCWEKKYVHLQREMKKAETTVKKNQIQIILSAANKSWQAAAWYLERRYHEDYARKENIDMTSKGKEIKGVIYMPPKKEEGEGRKEEKKE